MGDSSSIKSNLSPRTTEIVQKLISGQSIIFDGKTIGGFSDSVIKLLNLITINLHDLQEFKGNELLLTIQNKLPLIENTQVTPKSVMPSSLPINGQGYSLHQIQAKSFRGLAPAGIIWEHNFEGESHLLYGPNGCGKSSLLGAIAWCLTGYLFRDDSEPACPSSIEVYTGEKQIESEGTIPDALAIIDSKGKDTAVNEEYWVILELIRSNALGNREFLFLERHSTKGLSKSIDGKSWLPINDLSEVGINDIDAELQVLMPARLQYIRFGKNPDLIRVFSQIVGLDDLISIAEVSSKVHSAASRAANQLKNVDINNKQTAINSLHLEITNGSNETIKGLPAYSLILKKPLIIDNIKQFEESLKAEKEATLKRLLADLDITEVDNKLPTTKDVNKQLEWLPGQIKIALEKLCLPIKDLFPSTLTSWLTDAQTIEKTRIEYEVLVQSIITELEEKIDWQQKNKNNKSLALLLQASRYFCVETNKCPVCTQSLNLVPQIHEQLLSLQEINHKQHLFKDNEDFARYIIDRITKQLPPSFRSNQSIGFDSLVPFLQKDWTELKKECLKDLLFGIAGKFDQRIHIITAQFDKLLTQKNLPFFDNNREVLKEMGLDQIEGIIRSGFSYLTLSQIIHDKSSVIMESIARLISPNESGDTNESLFNIIARGKSASAFLVLVDGLLKNTRELYKSQKELNDLIEKETTLRELTSDADEIKALGEYGRFESYQKVKLVEPAMIQYYGHLYDDKIFNLDLVTPGHAANPNIKDQMNVYYRTCKRRIPIGPFSNAGRLRGLLSSFVFSLMNYTTGSLAFLLLDDPALSMDDEHKARFLDHLVQPVMGTKQVILATHYENFFKCAGSTFQNAKILQLPPKRRSEDAVTFEPADLLIRVENSLNQSTASWRETGNNLRRWGERTLHTISSYCPEPFVIFNNLPGTIDAYKKITDPKIVSPEREEIITALESNQFTRVMHRLAHDEEPTESEVRDGLNALKKCKKAVDKEIERFKKLQHHSLIGRAKAPTVEISTVCSKIIILQTPLLIIGRAAAATNGIGVEWSESVDSVINEYGIACMRCSTLEPVILEDQYVLFDQNKPDFKNADLVLVQFDSGEKYARRIWSNEQQGLMLENINPTTPNIPVHINGSHCEISRITGVLYEKSTTRNVGVIGKEWITPGGFNPNIGKGLKGVKVKGTSLEPLARDGQIILVKDVEPDRVQQGDLVCVQIKDKGAVIKRFYSSGELCILCSVNPVNIENPIIIKLTEIQHIYLLAGVLFDCR